MASRIISPQQHVFVAGRNISDCILTTSECFNLLNSKCHGGNLAIKVDITKAFDTLSWDFLLHVLQAFGFDPIFVQWVCALLLSAKLSLLINGRTVGYFSCERGVRQGDPLSPLLFCLAEEALSRGISLLVSSGQLQHISSPRNTLAPSHVLFADDVIVFCRGNRRNLSRIMRFFDEYGRVSGQVINKGLRRKSYAPSSIWPGVRQFWKTVQDNSQWLIGSGNGIYFWRDKFMGRPINEFFGSNVLMQDNSDLVSKYIDNGSWNIPPLLQLHYPVLCVEVVCKLISSHIRVTSHLTTGHMHKSVQELRILKCFGAPCRPRATLRVVEVNWIPPSLGWVKINSDGSWKHEEGVGGYGAIFRDYKGHFLGAFPSNLEIPSSISAEIMAVIKTIELA
ncbi:hypothetical protein ACLB2K_076173 [Fragaria x ananassa]